MAKPDAQGLRVVLYSHDSVGLGHTRRNLAIAQSLADSLPEAAGRRLSGLLITGEKTATSYRCPEGFDWVVIPGITKRSGGYGPRSLAVGTERLMDVRSSVIAGALTSFDPHIVIVDRHPFGVDGELAEPLRLLRAARPDVTLVLGLREVLDEPSRAAAEWEKVGADTVAELFDRIWIYGDEAAHDPFASGELPSAFRPMADYTGLLSAGRRSTGRTPVGKKPFVVTMVGGGSDGGAVAAAAAAAPVPAGYHHLVVAGPQMPKADRVAAESAAGEQTTVVKKVSDGLSYITQSEAVVCMTGYNTVAEILSTDTPALTIPRTQPRTEQLIRARGLAKTGALDMLHPDEATPVRIGEWIAEAVSSERIAVRQQAARAGIGRDGLARIVGLTADLAARTDRRIVPSPRAGGRPNLRLVTASDAIAGAGRVAVDSSPAPARSSSGAPTRVDRTTSAATAAPVLVGADSAAE